MNRATLLFGCVFISLLLLGCVSSRPGSSPTTGGSTPTNTNTTQGTANVARIGERIDFGDGIIITVLDVRKTKEIRDIGTKQASSEAIFVLFNAKFENMGKNLATISAEFRATDENDRNYGVAGGSKDDTGRFWDYTLNPGLTRTRINYYIEIPESVRTIKLSILKGLFNEKKGEVQISLSDAQQVLTEEEAFRATEELSDQCEELFGKAEGLEGIGSSPEDCLLFYKNGTRATITAEQVQEELNRRSGR